MGTNSKPKKSPIEIRLDYDSRHVWDRLDYETSKAFAAFVIFRDMGADRTIIESYRQYADHPQARATARYYIEWARYYKWNQRAEAWDDYCDRVKQRALTRELEKTAARHVSEIRNFSALVNKLQAAFTKRIEDNPSLRGVRMRDLLTSAIRAAAITPSLHEAELNALGKPKRIEVTGEGGGPVLIRYMPPQVVDNSDTTDVQSQEESIVEDGE